MARGYEIKTTAEIKKALKNEFNHKFSVRKGRGTASHWVSVSWVDGPTESAVREFCGQFNDNANDDTMTDLWCGSQYVSTHRRFSAGGQTWRVLGDIDLTKGNPNLEEMVRAAMKHVDGGWVVVPTEDRAKLQVFAKYEQDTVVEAFKALGWNVEADGNDITITKGVAA